jgi:hypothetical protein
MQEILSSVTNAGYIRMLLLYHNPIFRTQRKRTHCCTRLVLAYTAYTTNHHICSITNMTYQLNPQLCSSARWGLVYERWAIMPTITLFILNTFRRCPAHVFPSFAGFVYLLAQSLPLQNGGRSSNYDPCATSVKYG